MGIIADALGVPITLSRRAEGSSRGAALLALEGLGVSAPPPAPTGPTIAPDPARHTVHRAALARHRRLYDNVVGPGLS